MRHVFSPGKFTYHSSEGGQRVKERDSEGRRGMRAWLVEKNAASMLFFSSFHSKVSVIPLADVMILLSISPHSSVIH